MSWVAVVATAQNAWTIGFWHEDWNLNSMKKSRKLSSPIISCLHDYGPKDEWWSSLCACRVAGQGPDRATNCPSVCLHSPEMVTGQTAHFPWNWTKLGGACHMWQRRSRQDLRGTQLQIKARDQQAAKACYAELAGSIRSAPFCILSIHTRLSLRSGNVELYRYNNNQLRVAIPSWLPGLLQLMEWLFEWT